MKHGECLVNDNTTSNYNISKINNNNNGNDSYLNVLLIKNNTNTFK